MKKSRKIQLKKLVGKVSSKRRHDVEKKIKKIIIKKIKAEPGLYQKISMDRSVSTIVDQLIPLGKELVQHPEIVEEMTTNKKMQNEFCKNPTVTIQLLQIPEVADNAAREPSLIVEILKDASKIKTLTKSLSKSYRKPVVISKKKLRKMQENIVVEDPDMLTTENVVRWILRITLGLYLGLLMISDMEEKLRFPQDY
jgi:hypothetical protein